MKSDVLFHDGVGLAGFEALRAGVVKAPQIAGSGQCSNDFRKS